MITFWIGLLTGIGLSTMAIMIVYMAVGPIKEIEDDQEKN